MIEKLTIGVEFAGMDLMEAKENRKNEMDKMFSEKYTPREVVGEKSFDAPDGGIFRVTCLPGDWNALVIEYAESEEEAEINRFEDGDLFYMEDYPTAEEMFQAMLEEVEY